MSALSSRPISAGALGRLMEKLKAEETEFGWKLVRSERWVEVELGSDDLDVFDEDSLAEAARLLGAEPVSRVALIFTDSSADHFELRMAKAIAIAMAEKWPVVLDDHYGGLERIHAPGRRPD